MVLRPSFPLKDLPPLVREMLSIELCVQRPFSHPSPFSSLGGAPHAPSHGEGGAPGGGDRGGRSHGRGSVPPPPPSSPPSPPTAVVWWAWAAPSPLVALPPPHEHGPPRSHAAGDGARRAAGIHPYRSNPRVPEGGASAGRSGDAWNGGDGGGAWAEDFHTSKNIHSFHNFVEFFHFLHACISRRNFLLPNWLRRAVAVQASPAVSPAP